MARLLLTGMSRSGSFSSLSNNNVNSRRFKFKGLLSTTSRQFMASLCLLLMGAVMHSIVMDQMSDAEWFVTHSQTYDHAHPATSASSTAASTTRPRLRPIKKKLPYESPPEDLSDSSSGYSIFAGLYTPATKEPLPKRELQFDIVLPLFDRDDKVRAFAARLKPSLLAYQEELAKDQGIVNRITTFRLLLTRYSQAEVDTIPQLQRELADLTSLPLSQIVMIPLPNQQFHRASACNTLMDHACHESHCLVARIDVDMHILPEFFHHSAQFIIPEITAYFPIVWSEYNPESVRLVQQYMDLKAQQEYGTPQILERYSEHRGHWRVWGTGMFVLSGPDAVKLRFNEKFKGWGGEDGNFHDLVQNQRNIVRLKEPGLIHTWHEKNCRRGIDVFTDLQVKECHTSLEGEEGSELGKSLLAKWKQQQR